MFKISHPKELLAKIEDGIRTTLLDSTLIFPELKERILSNLLWGIFSEEPPFVFPENKLTDVNYSSLVAFSPVLFGSAHGVLASDGFLQVKFLDESVSMQLGAQNFLVWINYEDLSVKIADSQTLEFNSGYKGVIALTLPSAEVVFQELIDGDLFRRDGKNNWLFECMDTYTEWQYEIMESLHCYTWQFGGHGRWIQGDYNGTYLGQANISVGDEGSVFFSISPQGIEANIDMY